MMNLFALNVADFIIIGIVALSVIISLLRGFIREALSLATWIIAAYLAYTLSSSTGLLLSDYISSAATRSGVAFVGIFLAIIIVGAIVNFFIGRLISVSGLGLVDRLLGVVFGVLRGVLMIALVILMFQASSLTERQWWRHSQLIPVIEPISHQMQELFPKDVEPERSIEDINKGLLKPKKSDKQDVDE